jgi:hypothetical protein
MAKTLNIINKSLNDHVTDSLTTTVHNSLQTTDKTIKGSLAETFSEVIDVANNVSTLSNNVDALSGSMGTLSNLQTSAKSNLVAAINEVKNNVPTMPEISFDTFASVDYNTAGATGATKTADSGASNAYANVLTSTGTVASVFKATFPDMKFGKYALTVRVKVSANTGSSDIMTLLVNNGSTNILTKGVAGTKFDAANSYCYLATTFTYNSGASAKQPLSFELKSTTVKGIKISFDYAYITLITPAIYV